MAQVTLDGIVTYGDGPAAAGAMIRIMDRDSGSLIATTSSDDQGRYRAAVSAGTYALTAATSTGYAWIDKLEIPKRELRISLVTQCHSVHGSVAGGGESTRVNFQRQKGSDAETFAATAPSNGQFALCLPEGKYHAFLTGDVLSPILAVDIPARDPVHMQGFRAASIQTPPTAPTHLDASLRALVDDIANSKAAIIGLGEATHGTLEFTTARGALTFELIRHAGVRLLLFEFDAVTSVALDDYVNGADVDAGQAVTKLGFWITDTQEFLAFLAALRQYNAGVTDKVHLWGIDIQGTTPPIQVLTENASERAISASELSLLGQVTGRGKAVVDMSAAQRSELDALLDRLAVAKSTKQHDLLIAVAARSLSLQLGYWTGDMRAWYEKRRDVGMADMASFIVSTLGAHRACLWAHDSHVSKHPGDSKMGGYLARTAMGYYAVGFYQFSGSARAWDSAGKIGVISHPIPPASAHGVEHVVISSAGMPEIAWVPLHHLTGAMAEWFKLPRLVREFGAVFPGDDNTLRLRDLPASFDALAVIQLGHDSSPTPTGSRAASK